MIRSYANYTSFPQAFRLQVRLVFVCMIISLPLLLITVVNGAVIDSVPSACASACRPIASALDGCQYLTCLCTDAQGQNMQGCMGCLNGLSTSREISDAVQVALQGFTDTCKWLITLPLNITTTSSSSSSAPPAPSSSSGASASASASGSTTIPQSPISSSTKSAKTKAISSTSATSPSYTLVGQDYSDPQMCRLAPAGDRKRIASGSAPTPTPQAKVINNTHIALIVVSVAVFVPLAIIVLRM